MSSSGGGGGSGSSQWDRQLLRLTRSVFVSEKIDWGDFFFKNKIIFKHCTLVADIEGTDFKAGDTLERIEFKLESDNWHFRLYRTKKDKHTPLRMDFGMVWRGKLDNNNKN
jgi:hypothetical protein